MKRFGCHWRQTAHRARAFLTPRRWQLQIGAVLMGLCASSSSAITLDAALAKTLEKNPAILEAKFALEEAAGRRLVLRALSLPDARIQVLAGLQGGDRADQPATQPFGFARGFFRQPLVNFAAPAARRRGDVEVLLAKQRLNVAIVEQMHTARIAFYTALHNKSLRELGEAQRERLAQNVDTQSDRYQAGHADRGAISSARLLERELEPRIQEVHRSYEGALLTLALCMGSDLGPTAELTRPDGTMTFTPATHHLETETDAALSHRADLLLAR